MSIQDISRDLIKAVELIYNPYTPITHRNEAQKRIEEFKDTSPSCGECGFYLFSLSYPSVIRHFGLRLVDHYIKLHWNSISPEEKMHIKNSVFEILSKDIPITEEIGVKDALARIVVEIIKREWPQQWPSLLEELHSLCLMGDVQTELVLLILLRLAEDIVVFQNIPDKRRKEIYRSLCGHLKLLFPFFVSTLEDQCTKYFNYKQQMQPVNMNIHCHTACITLETLSVYMEWVPVINIKEGLHIFKLLSHLLHEETLQINAARCLLSLVERKGHQEDRKLILELFKENELLNIPCQGSQTLEKYHLFLKEYTKTLVLLGTTLCHLKTCFNDVKDPQSYLLYLNCVLSLTKHPSVVVSKESQALWLCLLRDKNYSENTTFHSIIPDLLKSEAEKLFKIGSLSKPNSKASQYSLVEFDCDEDFDQAFCKLCADILEVLKLIAKYEPQLAFNNGNSMFKALLSGQESVILQQIEDSSSLDLRLIWSAVSHYISAISISFIKNMDSPDVQNLAKEGIELLQMTLNFESEDLEIMSTALSCVSSLFFFANFYQDVLIPIFRKIFSNLIYHIPGNPMPLPKEALNLRRHSSALIIKLCTNHPKLLLTIFDHLCQSVKDMMDQPDTLSVLEKNALLESLMILSNELEDYEKQLNFLKDMLSSVIGMWLSDDIKLIVSSPENFITFVGLNKAPDDTLKTNRTQILFLTNAMKNCAKRCRIVTNRDIAEKGNFIHPVSQNLNSVYYRNPAAQLIIPALPSMFHLIRTLNCLQDPAVQAQFHPEFAGVMDISENDKYLILGTPQNNQQPRNATLERMKNYLQVNYDNCVQALGEAAQSLTIDFYMVPDLSNYLKDYLFYSLPNLPDTKLRVILRTFLKPFFNRCPVHLCGEFTDVLTSFCTFMLEKLSSTWQKFKQKYGTCIGYEDQMTESQEILEDLLTRLLTREYISLLGGLLQSKPGSETNDHQMDDDSRLNTSDSNHSKQLSEVGLKIFQNEVLRSVITCTVFTGLQWLDTVANIYCLQVCLVLLQHLIAHNVIQQSHEANYLLQTSLCGLQELGKHDSNQGLLLSLAFTVYDSLRPKFPTLSETLATTVGCDIKTVQRMETYLFKDGVSKPGQEKQKRDEFRKVVQNIIGKNIGEYYKREIVIKNLPPLFIIPKEKNPDIVELLSDTENVGLCNLFVPSS